jgi:hypothetical protein
MASANYQEQIQMCRQFFCLLLMMYIHVDIYNDALRVLVSKHVVHELPMFIFAMVFHVQ